MEDATSDIFVGLFLKVISYVFWGSVWSVSSLRSRHVCCVKLNGYFSASKKFILGEQGVKEGETSGQWKSEISNEYETVSGIRFSLHNDKWVR